MGQQNGLLTCAFHVHLTLALLHLFIFLFYYSDSALILAKRPRRPFVCLNIYFSQLIAFRLSNSPVPKGVPKKVFKSFEEHIICSISIHEYECKFLALLGEKAIKAFKYLHTQPEKSKQAQSPSHMQIHVKQLRALNPFASTHFFSCYVCRDFDFNFC